jgi:hypothetical protein
VLVDPLVRLAYDPRTHLDLARLLPVADSQALSIATTTTSTTPTRPPVPLPPQVSTSKVDNHPITGSLQDQLVWPGFLLLSHC